MCTTIAIGKDATTTGSVLIAHSDDDVSDTRVIHVPAQDYAAGSKRPVYYDDSALGPMIDPVTNKDYNANARYRYIGKSRGPKYVVGEEQMEREHLYESTKIGEIDQVAHTYAYFDSSYGVMNEKRLMLGECTCGAKVHPTPSNNRLFYAAELGRIALERCSSAREAVELMGSLILRYGFHGTGETLLVGDPDEAWVMEMCGYDPNGSDGIWVAQRVPDNGFFVAANQFRIRDIIPDSADMMYSENLHDVCSKLGWWDPAQSPTLDWAATVSFGEYSHPYYSLRRVWRALQKAKPSAILPVWVENAFTKAYPFAIVPDVKLDVAGLIAIYRDNYEHTQFDQTKGAAAGPWGDPSRYEVNPDQGNSFELGVFLPSGAWERPISIYRCGMIWINEANRAQADSPANGVTWLGLDRPASTCLMPLYCQVTYLPSCIQTMNLTDFDFDSLWWAFNFVANYCGLKYVCMIEDVQKAQLCWEQEAYQLVQKLAADSAVDAAKLTSSCAEHAERLRKAWWKLAKHLIVTYNDGCRTTPDNVMQMIDYPSPWLEKTSYFTGPVSYDQKECRDNPCHL
jgi:dipeptidase